MKQIKIVLMLSPAKAPTEGGILTCTKRLISRGLPNGWKLRIVDTRIIGRKEYQKYSILAEFLRTARILCKQLYEILFYRPDVGHINSSLMRKGLLRERINAGLFALAKIPFVLQIRCDTKRSQSLPTVSARALGYIMQRSSKVIVFPGISTNDFQEKYNLPKNTFVCMPNPLDESSLPSESDGNPHLRRICMLGRTSVEKGFLEFVECARAFPDITFTFAGAILNEARPIIDNMPPNVELCGQLQNTEAMKLLAGSMIFLFTSHMEGFPVTVLEAMGLGLPIVATDVGSVSHMVDDGEGGHVVPVKDTDAMVAALERLIGDSELCKRMGEHNRKKVVSEYSYEHVTALMTAVYDEITR